MDLLRRGTNKNEINNSDINLVLQNSWARGCSYRDTNNNFIEREAPSRYAGLCKSLNSRLFRQKQFVRRWYDVNNDSSIENSTVALP